jgi:hypothetical protein
MPRRGLLNRRQFISLLGAATIAWPLAACAQQTMPVLGFLGALSPEGFNEPMRGFRQELRESGFIEADNLTPTLIRPDNEWWEEAST